MNILSMAIASSLLAGSALSAQVAHVTVQPLTDADIALIRQDIQDVKDSVIKDTMKLSDTEATAFWPVYKDYAAAQHGIAAKRFEVIVQYAKNLDTLTDTQARDLTERMIQVEDDAQALRKAYFPKFEAALGARRAAKFYQVDNRLTMILNVQLASEVPLIP